MTSVAGPTVRIEPVLAQKSIDVGGIQDMAALGNLLYTVSAEKSLRSWNQSPLSAEKSQFPTADGPLRAVAVAKNQILLATGGDDKTIRVFSVPDGKLLGSSRSTLRSGSFCFPRTASFSSRIWPMASSSP